MPPRASPVGGPDDGEERKGRRVPALREEILLLEERRGSTGRGRTPRQSEWLILRASRWRWTARRQWQVPPEEATEQGARVSP